MEVYIILTDTGSMLTRMIKMFTKDSYNHASIAFNKELDSPYSFGRKKMNNPFIGGFVKENLTDRIFQQAPCAIYSRKVSANEYERMLALVQAIESQQHTYKYNFIGLFGFVFNRQIERKNAFFCSEFVATVLNNGGIKVNRKPASLVKPTELIECEEFRLIYEGQLDSFLSNQGKMQEVVHSKNKAIRNRFQQLNSKYLKKVMSIAG
ncbi:hypothetical protein [Sutcliffiella halmapala]|uniref:hypothetical protein n=1 Tax=Sutcliffiella halmapala TaxID=79882 RepID=UPI00111725D3|nr:hypothetical protein [Sutcliffiella halmapala]